MTKTQKEKGVELQLRGGVLCLDEKSVNLGSDHEVYNQRLISLLV